MYVPGRFQGQVFVVVVGGVVEVSFLLLSSKDIRRLALRYLPANLAMVDLETTYPRLDILNRTVDNDLLHSKLKTLLPLGRSVMV